MFEWIGLALGAAGVAALYSSWRKLPLSGPWVVAAGWLLVAVSLWSWVAGAGAEFGISYGLIAFSLLGAVLVLYNFELRERKLARSNGTRALTIDPRSWGRHGLLLVAAVPLAGLASTLLTVWLASFLPWHPTDRMVLAVLLVPVIWGLAAWWACADSRPLRPVSVLGAAAVLPALILYL